MSSSNNAAPDDTVINVENDATPISNQNQSTVPQENGQESQTSDNPFTDDETASFLMVMTVLSLFLGTNNIFPVLFPISLCSFIMAAYAVAKEKYYLLMPFMLTLAWNTFYGIICVIFFISFYAGGKEFFLNKALYFCWAEKAEMFEKIGDSCFFFVSHLVFTVFEILFNFAIYNALKLRFAKLQQKYVEEIRREYGEQSVQSDRESLQQSGLTIVSNEQFQAGQALSNEQTNPYVELIDQIPPPPIYQSNTRLSPPQTPRNGTPPPTYSMLEREHLDLDSLHHSQQSINNLLSDTTQISIDTTLSSPNNSNESTAMSPSSIF